MGHDNLSRTRIESIVAANPGIHLSQVAVVAGLAWNTCLHHVRVLESQQRICRTKVDGKVRLFDRRAGAFQAKEAAAVLQCPTNRRLAAYALQNPGRHQRDLAKSLGLSTTAMHRRISRLEEAGLVRRLQHGRMSLVQATDKLVDAFVESGLRTPPAPVSIEMRTPGKQEGGAPAWQGEAQAEPAIAFA